MSDTKPHSLISRVYYPDTDAGGVVYHGKFLAYFDHGRTELLRDCQVDMSVLQEEQGLIFVVSKLDIKYSKPGRLDDEFRIETCVDKIRSRSMNFVQRIILKSAATAKERVGETLVAANVSVVCVNTENFKVVSVPKTIRQQLINN